MDPITHTLAGVAMARTLPADRRPLAALTLGLAANVPDVDVVAYLAGSDAGLGFRRGLTHGPLGLALLPLAVVAVVALLARRAGRGDAVRGRLGWLVGLAYVGAMTHPALDWLNNYGVRLLSPFDDRWFYGDAVFIVDPWLWLLLGAAVYWGRDPGPRRWWVASAVAMAVPVIAVGVRESWASVVAWSLLLIAVVALDPLRRGRRLLPWCRAATMGGVAYLALLVLTSGLARQRVAAELDLAGSPPPSQLMVGPLPLTWADRDVVVVEGDVYRWGRFRWGGSPEVTLEGESTRPRPGVESEALADPRAAGFARWSRFPMARVEGRGSTRRVILSDVRFARLPGGDGSGLGAVLPLPEGDSR